MLNDNNIEEIDLSKVNWNNLKIEEYYLLEQKLLSNVKKNKLKIKTEEKIKAEEKIGMIAPGLNSKSIIVIKLRDKNYNLIYPLYMRLRKLKSLKSKEKLIDEIISTHTPIIEI